MIAGYRKAIGGAIGAVCTWFASSFADGITDQEWAVLPLAIFVTGGLVAILKNEPSVPPGEDGGDDEPNPADDEDQ